MKTSMKGYIMQTLPSQGRKQVTVYAMSIADAKAQLKAEYGIDFYFKGYTSD